MSATVYADPEPQTLNTLKRRLRKAWKLIPLKTLKNLIGSMPDRLEAVIKSKGNIIPQVGLTLVNTTEVHTVL